jgi:hypothetical protein
MIETEKQTDCHVVPPRNDDYNKQIAKLSDNFRNYSQCHKSASLRGKYNRSNLSEINRTAPVILCKFVINNFENDCTR